MLKSSDQACCPHTIMLTQSWTTRDFDLTKYNTEYQTFSNKVRTKHHL